MVIAGFLAACGGNDKKAEEVKTEEMKPLVSRNTDVFNQSFEKMLASYENLKNGLVEYDTVAVNAAALQLATAADSLALNEIKGDSTGAVKETAATYSQTISTSSKTLASEKELEKKKRQFQSISDAMYDLVRTVKYDKQKIYHQSCPMAFNDEEQAYWISISDEVINPYLGKKHPKYKDGMLHCGEVADSLNFVQ